MPSASYLVWEAGTNRPFRVRGTGATLADALAEANAKLAMTVGVVKEATYTDDIDPGDAGAVASAAGLFSDANLVLRNAAGKVVTVRLENITTSIGTGVNGMLDLTDPLITGFAAVYKDGADAGGYTPYDGKFIGSNH